MNSSNVQYFAAQLLDWYDREKRDLPWRRSRDPYRIWVSEIMLQQTRVETVIPYYERFIARFPTPRALAEAPEEEVLKAWEGLGYYSRARHLHAAARDVCDLYGGEVPDDPEAVAGLRGVGPYTAGAILSIAFNRPEPAVDGNVMRVLSRFFLLEDDVAKPATRVKVENLVRRLLPEGRPGDFNQALMDLGATVCTPKRPGCLACPVMERCEGRLQGRERELPIKTKSRKPRPEYRAVALIEGSGEHAGKLLIRQRPPTGLLAGMWELPHVRLPGQSFTGAEDALLGCPLPDGRAVVPREPFMDIEHVFSHIRWIMRVYLARLTDGPVLLQGPGKAHGRPDAPDRLAGDGEGAGPARPAEGAERPDALGGGGTGFAETRWIGPGDREDHPFPNVFVRILDHYWNDMHGGAG